MVQAFLPTDSTDRKLRGAPHPPYSTPGQTFPLAGRPAEAGCSGAVPGCPVLQPSGAASPGRCPAECSDTLWSCSGPSLAHKSWPTHKRQEGFRGATMHSRVRCQHGFRGQSCLSHSELDPASEERQPRPGAQTSCSLGQQQHISDLLRKSESSV